MLFTYTLIVTIGQSIIKTTHIFENSFLCKITYAKCLNSLIIISRVIHNTLDGIGNLGE